MLYTLIFLAILLLVYFGYMKFYYPKFKQKFEENEKQAKEEWEQNQEKIINEYLTNPNKFGLISDVTEGETIIGMMSGSLPEGFKSTVMKSLKDTITFTKSVDMSHYYLVATDKGMHYLGFDGEKCFINEVFDYNLIQLVETTKKTLSFDYKNEKIKFNVDNESPIALSGYPRFEVHERSKAATSNDRTLNYFVREYFAYEPTDNASFKASNQIASFNTGAFQVSLEKSMDFKVREHFVKQFKQKMKIR